MRFHEDWIHLRSPNKLKRVQVHPAERGKANVFRRYGWEDYTPIPVSIEALNDAFKKAGTQFKKLGESISDLAASTS